MTKGSACLSESSSLEQERCVQTKAPLSKDHLQQFLSGLINRSHDLSNAPGEIKSYLRAFFRGEGKVSFRLIEFLHTILSGDIPQLPSEKGLKKLHHGWKIYTETYEIGPAPVFEKFFQSVEYASQNADFWEDLYRFFKEEKPAFFEKAISNLSNISKREYAYLFDYSFRGYLDFREFLMADNRELIKFCNVLNYHKDLSDEDKLELIYHKFGNNQWQTNLDKYEVQGMDLLAKSGLKDKVIVIKGFLDSLRDFNENNKSILNEHLNFWMENCVIYEREEASKVFLNELLKEAGNEAISTICKLEEEAVKELEQLLDHVLFISEFYSDISSLNLGNLYRNLAFYLQNKEYAVRSFETIDKVIDHASYTFSHFSSEILGPLFFKFEVPWLLVNRLNEIPNGYNLLEWLIHGNKLKDFNYLPIRVTKKETHVFFNMYSKSEARALLNNSENVLHAGIVLAKIKNIFHAPHLIESLRVHYSNVLTQYEADFWEDLTRFFKRYKRQIERGEIRNLLDYLLAEKNENPGYTLKGRTYNSVNQAMHEWHEQMQQMRYLQHYGLNLETSWKGSSIQNSKIQQGEIEYHFYQIKNQKELHEEGSSMHHCVSSYGKDCVRGEVSIWSLRIYNQKGIHRLLTIEVKDRKIVQVKGKHNRMPGEVQEQVLRVWAGKHGFKIRSY